MAPKVVLVTGASSGIGKACAELLSARGHRVYGTSRSPSFAPGKFQPLVMDVTDDVSVKEAVDRLIARERRLDVLINNAGYGLAGPIEDTTTNEAHQQLEVNLLGPFRVCRSVLPQMRSQRCGLIVNISSLGGLFGLPFQGFYSASKFALEGLSESLRYEVAPFGIQVALVEPGDIRTNITANRAQTETANSVYTKQFYSVLKTIEREELNGAGANYVADLVLRIVEGRSTRLRHTTGHWSQRLSATFKRLAPYSIFERVLRFWYGVPGLTRAPADAALSLPPGQSSSDATRASS